MKHNKIEELKKEVVDIERDYSIIKTKKFQEKVLNTLKAEGILKPKGKIERLCLSYIDDKLNDVKNRISKIKQETEELTERAKHYIEAKLKKHEKRIIRLEEDVLTCPICFRKFDKAKSFTNHIREYRKKLEKIKNRKEKPT